MKVFQNYVFRLHPYLPFSFACFVRFASFMLVTSCPFDVAYASMLQFCHVETRVKLILSLGIMPRTP